MKKFNITLTDWHPTLTEVRVVVIEAADFEITDAGELVLVDSDGIGIAAFDQGIWAYVETINVTPAN